MAMREPSPRPVHSGPHTCPKGTRWHGPACELTFNSIVEGLFREGIVPPGGVLDVGAHDGQWSCMYACFDPSRIVYAVEGNQNYFRLISSRCQERNVRPLEMALGSTSGWSTVSADIQNVVTESSLSGGLQPASERWLRHHGPNGTVPVRTVDELSRTYRYLPSPTVTYRYLPLPTVTGGRSLRGAAGGLPACRLRGARARSAAGTCRYLPSPTVTYRHLPLPTVAYRYLPLPTVTYRYLPSSDCCRARRGCSLPTVRSSPSRRTRATGTSREG